MKRSVCDCGRAFVSKKRKAQCTAVGEPESAMKRRKALLSEEELLLVRKGIDKVGKRASKTHEHTKRLDQTYLMFCCSSPACQSLKKIINEFDHVIELMHTCTWLHHRWLVCGSA